MLLAKLVPLPPAAQARTKLITLVQDGQLGWVALGYATSCTYDNYAYVTKMGEKAVGWASITLLLTILIIAVSAFMAALGALFPYDGTQPPPTSWWKAIRQYSTFVGTFVTMLMPSLSTP